MPYFNFDLVIGDDFKSQGGMILEDTEIAIDKADSLASDTGSKRRRVKVERLTPNRRAKTFA
jgi:hypothetical protein